MTLDPQRATAPTDAEVERLTTPLPPALTARLASATAPTEREVARLARVSVHPPAARVAPVVATLALLAAMAALLLRPPAVETAFVPEPIHAEVLRFDAVEVTSVGVTRAVEIEGGVRVDVDRGAATVIVEPATGYDALELRVGAVQLTGRAPVTLDASRAGEAVEVRLERGRLEVRLPDGTVSTMDAPALFTWSPPPSPATAAVAPAPRTVQRERIVPPSDPPEAPPTRGEDARAFQAILDGLETGASHDDVVADLRAFVAVWQDSPYAVEAGALLLRETATTADAAQWVADADAWRATAGRSPRRAEITLLEADVLRVRLRRCSDAIPLYAMLHGGATGTPARAGKGLCEAEVGNRDAAAVDLASALAAGLDGRLRAEVTLALDELGVE